MLSSIHDTKPSPNTLQQLDSIIHRKSTTHKYPYPNRESPHPLTTHARIPQPGPQLRTNYPLKNQIQILHLLAGTQRSHPLTQL